MARLAGVVLACLLLAACGWQLRGAGVVSLQGLAVAVTMQENLPEIEREVRNGLIRAGAEVVDEPTAADAVVVVVGEQRRRRTLAADRDARVQEYELEYGLRFRVEGPDGDPWAGPEVVSSYRGYRYDRDDVLGTEAREAIVLEELRRDTTRLLLARAQAAIGRNL